MDKIIISYLKSRKNKAIHIFVQYSNESIKDQFVDYGEEKIKQNSVDKVDIIFRTLQKYNLTIEDLKKIKDKQKQEGEDMEYNKIIEGIFLKRPNRFIAQVLIDGKEETVHVKNTGRCRELLLPGVKVILEDCSQNINRKTKYSLIAVWKGDVLINMDSQVPNAVVFQALHEKKVAEIDGLIHLKREVTFGKSRYDMYFETQSHKGFIEVKGVTLENDGISMFPDAPTERGTKHVLEMIEAVNQGYKGIIFFLVQMKGPKVLKLNWHMDRAFSEAVKLASESGVEIIAYDAIVKDRSICLDKPVKIDMTC